MESKMSQPFVQASLFVMMAIFAAYHLQISSCPTFLPVAVSLVEPHLELALPTFCDHNHTVVLFISFFFIIILCILEYNFHSLEHSNQQNKELDGKEIVETEQCRSRGNIAVSEDTTLCNAGTVSRHM
jgi:hypothetical protein